MKVSSKGFSVIEIVVSAALIAISIAAIVAAINVFLKISFKNTNQAQAALLLEETTEVLQYLRDSSWDGNIASTPLNTEYQLDWNGSDYATTTSPVLVNGKFTRTYQLSEVSRDSNDDIVSSGGTADPNTFLVDVNVSWQETDGSQSVSSQFLIHNVYQD